MFCKHYDVDPNHVDFQGVVDGLYYPFYLEWARHAYMAEALGLVLEEEFKQGRIHMLLEYTLKFKRSLKAGDKVVVTCQPQKNEKRSRVNFVSADFGQRRGLCGSGIYRHLFSQRPPRRARQPG
uniref:Thioesterase domain-containing protein n=1 Tax=Erwinia pyrifoliae TaxID=79967 RepID=Q3HY03_ERWPY|nr:unknown [Erwinia pyrifoliae]